MSKSRRSNRDQLRARQETALEKKWLETVKQQHIIRNKNYDASIAKEIVEHAKEVEVYETALTTAYGSVDDSTLRRRIEDIRQELLNTTSSAQDLVELLDEMEDELNRRHCTK